MRSDVGLKAGAVPRIPSGWARPTCRGEGAAVPFSVDGINATMASEVWHA